MLNGAVFHKSPTQREKLCQFGQIPIDAGRSVEEAGGAERGEFGALAAAGDLVGDGGA